MIANRTEYKYQASLRITRCLLEATLPQIALWATSQTPRTLDEIGRFKNRKEEMLCDLLAAKRI